MIALTMICPEAMFGPANEYARARGASEDDGQTWVVASFEKDGVRYGLINTVVRPEWLSGAGVPVTEPEWGCDLPKALQAQAAIRLWMVQGEMPALSSSTIVALVGVDAASAVALYALSPVHVEV